MSFQTIEIHRDYTIIDGWVQVPHNKESDKSRVTAEEASSAIDGSAETRLTIGFGRNRGWGAGAHSFLRLPSIHPNESYVTVLGANPVDILSGL